MAKRKSKEEFRQEHENFVALLKQQHPALAIMARLGLTLVQFNKHMLVAYRNGEIEKSEWTPEYELVRAGTLSPTIQEMLYHNIQVVPSHDALIKVARHEGGVLLSPESLTLHASHSFPPAQTVFVDQGVCASAVHEGELSNVQEMATQPQSALIDND